MALVPAPCTERGRGPRTNAVELVRTQEIPTLSIVESRQLVQRRCSHPTRLIRTPERGTFPLRGGICTRSSDLAGVRETALLARPLGLSHIPAAICQKTDGEERQRQGREGALGWPLTTHWTFPLSLLQRNSFWLPTRHVHTNRLVSLLWVMSVSIGVLCPCVPCCAPTGLAPSWELGSWSALCWTVRDVQR